MEEELIGGGTDDQGRATAIEKSDGLRVQGETMDKHCAIAEDLHAVQIEDLLCALCVDPFGRVKNEGKVGRRVVKVVDQVWIHLE